jgi:hypothetical protein
MQGLQEVCQVVKQSLQQGLQTIETRLIQQIQALVCRQIQTRCCVITSEIAGCRQYYRIPNFVWVTMIPSGVLEEIIQKAVNCYHLLRHSLKENFFVAPTSTLTSPLTMSFYCKLCL